MVAYVIAPTSSGLECWPWLPCYFCYYLYLQRLYYLIIGCLATIFMPLCKKSLDTEQKAKNHLTQRRKHVCTAAHA